MQKRVPWFVYWPPRILGILFILWLMLFSLDIFDGNYGFWGTVLGLFMHNIPALVLLLVLIISWKYEIVGGIVFILAGLFYVGMLVTNVLLNPPPGPGVMSWSFPIAGPAFLVGILFLICWFRKRR